MLGFNVVKSIFQIPSLCSSIFFSFALFLSFFILDPGPTLIEHGILSHEWMTLRWSSVFFLDISSSYNHSHNRFKSRQNAQIVSKLVETIAVSYPFCLLSFCRGISLIFAIFVEIFASVLHINMTRRLIDNKPGSVPFRTLAAGIHWEAFLLGICRRCDRLSPRCRWDTALPDQSESSH